MRYEILDNEGKVINTIVATQEFVEFHYPGRYKKLPDIPVEPMPEPKDPLAEIKTKLDNLMKEVAVIKEQTKRLGV